jgi:hypothetical protein
MESRFGHDISKVRIHTAAQGGSPRPSADGPVHPVVRHSTAVIRREPAAGKPATVDEQIREEIGKKPSDPKQKEEWLGRLERLFQSVLNFNSRPLYERLSKGSDGDAFAQLFFERLDKAERDKLLDILRWKYLPNSAGEKPALASEPASGYWEFGLVGNAVMARSINGASYASLANGSFGSGTAPSGTTVDIVKAFPAWVKTALTQQVATGVKFSQTSSSASPLGAGQAPGGLHAFQYELGYGNCHGFSFHLFKLFDDEPIKKWVSDKTEDSAPAGVPSVFGEFPPKYQVVHVHYKDEAGQKPEAQAIFDTYSKQGGKKWAAVLNVGLNEVEKRVMDRGGGKASTPEFGYLGLKIPQGGTDHSAIVLGRMGSTHVYVLQKDSPMNPYLVTLVPIAKWQWYRVP